MRIASRLLKPQVLITRVIHHQVHDHPNPPLMSLCHQVLQIIHNAVVWQNLSEIPDVIAAIQQRGIKHWRQPDAIHPQPLQVIQHFRQTLKIANAVTVGIFKSLDQHLIKHCLLIPIMRMTVCHTLRSGSIILQLLRHRCLRFLRCLPSRTRTPTHIH